MKLWIPILSLAALLASCTADSYQRVPMPSQSVEISSPSVSRIYVIRMPVVQGKLRAMQIHEDEREIGRIGSDSYVCWERPPGRTLVVVTHESTIFSKDDQQTMIDVQAEAGKVYYYGLTIDETWAKPVARPLERDEARAVMKKQDPAPAH